MQRCNLRLIAWGVVLGLTLGFVPRFASAAEPSGCDPADPLGTLSIVLTGQAARANLADLLQAIAKDLGTPANTDNNQAPLQTTGAVTSEAFWQAADLVSVWPGAQRVGTEERFERYFRDSFKAFGLSAFPYVETSAHYTTQRRLLSVAPGQEVPNSKNDLSDETLARICQGWESSKARSATDTDCVIRLEASWEPRVDKQGRLLARYVWIKQTGFRIEFKNPFVRSEANKLGTRLRDALSRAVVARAKAAGQLSGGLPLDEFRLGFQPACTYKLSSQSAAPEILSNALNCSADLLFYHQKLMAWPNRLAPIQREDSTPSPTTIIIADSGGDDSRFDTIRNQFLPLAPIKDPIDCRQIQPRPATGIDHTLAIASIIAGPRNTIQLINGQYTSNINFQGLHAGATLFVVDAESLDRAKDILSAARDAPEDVSTRIVTVVPTAFASAPAAESGSIFEDETHLGLLQVVAQDVLPIIAVPSIRTPDEDENESLKEHLAKVTGVMSASRSRHAAFESAGHELQSPPKASECNTLPTCLAATPFAVGVAALDRNNKLMDPGKYLLGSRWTWVAAPGFEVIAAPDPMRVGLYTGSSFAVPHVATLIWLIMNDVMALKGQRWDEITAQQVALLVATTSDLVPADETVKIRDKSVPMYQLVRYGRINAARSIAVSRTGMLTEPVVISGKDGELQMVPGDLYLNKALHCGKNAAKLRIYATQFTPEFYRGRDSACLDTKKIVRISPVKKGDRENGFCHGLPLLDIVYLESSIDYGSDRFKDPVPIVLRNVQIAAPGTKRDQSCDDAGEPLRCDLRAPVEQDPNTSRMACLGIRSGRDQMTPIYVQEDHYFGRFVPNGTAR